MTGQRDRRCSSTHTGRADIVDAAPGGSASGCGRRVRGAGAGRRGRRPAASVTSTVVAGRRAPATGSRSSWCSAATARSCARPSCPRRSGVPLLGVNLGRVGFLAEAEPDALDDTVRHVVERRYEVEERLTLDVDVTGPDGLETTRLGAERGVGGEVHAASRMLDVVLEIDGRPLTSFGCDGVVCATPTGSTAYAFSAGGPVVWPAVEALLVVPSSAHALFARPLVVGARLGGRRSTSPPTGTAACSPATAGGRPDIPPGSRLRGPSRRAPGAARPHPRRAVHRPAGGEVRPAGHRLPRSPASGRPALSWRPATVATGVRVGLTACSRRSGSAALGVIEDATLRARPRPDRGHRRDRRRQDDGGHRAGPAARRPGRRRRWCAATRPGPWSRAGCGWTGRRAPALAPGDRGRRRGRRRRRPARRPHGRSPKAGPGPTSAAGRVPVGLLAELADDLVAVHGQSDQLGLLRPAAAARRPGPVRRRRRTPRCWPSSARRTPAGTRSAPTSPTAPGGPANAGQEADLLRHGLAEIAELAPEPGEDDRLSAEARRLANADDLRLAARDRAHRAGRRPRRHRAPTSTPARCSGSARRSLEQVDDPDLGALAARIGEAIGTLRRRRRRARGVRITARRRPGPAGRGRGPAGGAAVGDPQVRRQRRRHPRLGPGGAGQAGPARRVEDDRWPRWPPSGTRSPTRTAELAGKVSAARAKAGNRFAAAVTAELAALAMPRRLDRRRRAPPARPSPARRHLHGRHGEPSRIGPDGFDEVEIQLVRTRSAAPAGAARRVRRRAVPGDARHRGRPRRHRPGADDGLRRGRRRRRRPGRRRGRPPAGPARPRPPGRSSSPTCPRSRRTPTGIWSSPSDTRDGADPQRGAAPRRRGAGPRAGPDAGRAGRHRARPGARRGAARAADRTGRPNRSPAPTGRGNGADRREGPGDGPQLPQTPANRAKAAQKSGR